MRVGCHIEFAAAFLGDKIRPFDARDIVAGIGTRFEVDLHAHAAFGGTREQLTEGFVVHHIENGQMVWKSPGAMSVQVMCARPTLWNGRSASRSFSKRLTNCSARRSREVSFSSMVKPTKMQMGGRNDDEIEFF